MITTFTTSPHGRRFLDLAGWPLWPNPWPDGVGVEWVRGEGWVPHFDVDARELLADYHAFDAEALCDALEYE